MAEMLPGLDELRAKPKEVGPLEASTTKTIDKLRAGGWITDENEHLAALAIGTARDYDHMERTKAYGVAQMTQAVAKVFEMLPAPEAAGASSEFDKLLETMSGIDGDA